MAEHPLSPYSTLSTPYLLIHSSMYVIRARRPLFRSARQWRPTPAFFWVLQGPRTWGEGHRGEKAKAQDQRFCVKSAGFNFFILHGTCYHTPEVGTAEMHRDGPLANLANLANLAHLRGWGPQKLDKFAFFFFFLLCFSAWYYVQCVL